jgi:hypothetical protein
MFNSPFNNTPPNSIFSSPFQVQNPEDRLNQIYQEMEILKQKQNGNVQQKTVFTEIADEMKDISIDERRYIESSDEYISASQQYQNDFSMFLIDNFGAEFSRSKYGKSTEKILAIIRKKKEDYKNHFAENISEIKEQNSTLSKQNDVLAKTNLDLQKQLAEIQKQLGGITNDNTK